MRKSLTNILLVSDDAKEHLNDFVKLKNENILIRSTLHNKATE